MSKAIIGAFEIAGALAIDLVATLSTAGIAAAFEPLFWSLLMGGIATEAGAIAAAIGGQQGIGITTRQSAGLRQIVYGVQRIGGTTIYQSTTGVGGSGGNYVFNYVICLATHEIDAIQNIYLDGRRVYWKQDGNAANVGCGTVSTPPSTLVHLSGGSVVSATATGGSGFAGVKPSRYRVRFQGDGSGAAGYATNSGTITSPVWSIHITAGGSGYTTCTCEVQGAFNFGGVAASDEQDPTQPGFGIGYGIGPGGPHYNFDGKVYCEARFGDQPPGDYMASLSANDSTWPSTARVAGCAYIYLNVGYTQSQFPNAPEIKLTINGKNTIFDPRTGNRGFSTNWALQVADVITDPVFGLGDQVNTAQLIAAANVCDQPRLTSQGNEAWFTQHMHYDTGTSPGEALSQMMPTAAGRLSYISGQWYIWPAYWQGPSFTFDQSALIDTPSWQPYRSFKELFNRVNGTYIAPNYPYSVVGNLYDKNGWYYGVTSNVWPLAFQPTNFPQYAADTLHGFGSDVFLAQDGGIQLPLELSLRGCLSIVQAQYVAKVHLLRNRFQGSGQFRMKLGCYQMQPTDVMQFSMPAMSWFSKNLEVSGPLQLAMEPLGDGDKVPALFVDVPVIETDPSIYEWSLGEELTPYDVPAAPGQAFEFPQPVTGLTIAADPTAVTRTDGNTARRLLVQWTPPNDPYVNFGGFIQAQWRDTLGSGGVGGGNWIDIGTFNGLATFCHLNNVSTALNIAVQVRALWANGAASDWVTAFNIVGLSRVLLSAPALIGGTTVNPAVASSMADLPELGAANAAMTIAARGNPCLLGLNLKFAALAGGGTVTGIPGLSLPTTTGVAPPGISISISGDGAGAGASVSWVPSGSGPSFTWTPTLSIGSGAGYTTATATVTITSNGDPGYTSGVSALPCTITAGTPASGIPVNVQVLMDGAAILGPVNLVTDSNGYATLNTTELILPAPSAASHSFQVQASTPSGTIINSTTRTFQLVELA